MCNTIIFDTVQHRLIEWIIMIQIIYRRARIKYGHWKQKFFDYLKDADQKLVKLLLLIYFTNWVCRFSQLWRRMNGILIYIADILRVDEFSKTFLVKIFDVQERDWSSYQYRLTCPVQDQVFDVSSFPCVMRQHWVDPGSHYHEAMNIIIYYVDWKVFSCFLVSRKEWVITRYSFLASSHHPSQLPQFHAGSL